MQLYAHLRLGFPTAPVLYTLTSLHTVTRRPVLQKVRGRTHKVLPQIVNTGFQVLFHSPPGVLFTFPSRYFFAIGHQVVFSLGRWSSRLPTGFLVSRGTLVPASCFRASTTGLLPSLAQLSSHTRLTLLARSCRPVTPSVKNLRFRLFPVRSPLLRKSNIFFLFLRVLRCFSSPGSLLTDYVFICG